MFRLQHRGNQVIEVFLLPEATRGIAIVAIIVNYLLPLVWDMRCHGRKPIEGIIMLSITTHISITKIIDPIKKRSQLAELKIYEVDEHCPACHYDHKGHGN